MLELNQIYNMDCMDGMKQIPDNSIRTTVTSPPYFKMLAYESGFNSYLQFIDWCKEWIKEIYRITEDEGYFFLNFANDKTNTIKAYEILNIALKYFTLHDTIIWYRYNSQPVNTDRQLTPQYEFVFMLCKNPKNYHLNKKELMEEMPDLFDTKNVGNVWKIAFNKKGKLKGFSMKKQNEDASNGLWGHSGYPVDLPKACILLTTNENDVVLDLFMGSGTTAVACINTNRQYIGFELDTNYFNIANKRIENHTQQLSIGVD
jgi:DNA modification methylase